LVSRKGCALIAEEEVEKDLHDLIFKTFMTMQCVFCAGVLCSEFLLIIYERTEF